MDRHRDLSGQLARLSGLAEAQRRRLYAFVAAAGAAVSRDEAATAVGISRPLAAYHLDRLVDDGLLDARYERRTGRSGPGAGRPAKLYLRSSRPVELSVPAREYAFLAELLAGAVESEESGAAQAALCQAAYDAGAATVIDAAADEDRDTSPTLQRALVDRGYEPYTAADGSLRLRNCPFHRLAERHRELVCKANLAFVEGMAAAIDTGAQPRLDPQPGECCVAVVPLRE